MACTHLVLHDKAYMTIRNEEMHDNEMASIVFHSLRRSILTVTTSSLHEVDVETGLLSGYVSFDLSTAVYIAPIPTEEKDKCIVLDQLVPVGNSFAAAVYQSRYMISWDLDEMVLYSFDELEKSQKNITALTASLDRDNMIFYTVEASRSIKTRSLDSGENTKKITCKASSRNAIPVTLAFCTLARLLCVGHTDGSFQLWNVQSAILTCTNKEEAAMATLVASIQCVPSTVVSLSFKGCGGGLAESHTKQDKLYFAVAYRNKTLEVWKVDIATDSESLRNGDPLCIASTQISANLSTAGTDFSKKCGKVDFCWHQLDSILLVHWVPQTGSELNHRLIAWDYRASIQSNTYPVFINSSSTIDITGKSDELNWFTTARSLLYWSQYRPLLYTSAPTETKIIELFVSQEHVESEKPAKIIQELPHLSTQVPLALNSYLNYRAVPSFIYNIHHLENFFFLRCVSLQNGVVKQVERLPSWNTDDGKMLFPWQFVANENQSMFCIKLRALNRFDEKNEAKKVGCTGNKSQYVTLSFNADTEPEGVKYGALFKARKVAFVSMELDETHKNCTPSYLLVLDVTGRILRTHNDHHDSNYSVTLSQEIQQFFVTPLRSGNGDNSHQKLHHRLIYTAIDDCNNTELLFFGDELSKRSQNLLPHRYWRSQNAERILNVSWNKPGLTENTHGDDGSTLMAAVLTTDRIIILSESLTAFAKYSIPYTNIQSTLWIAQSLLLATREGHLRYLTPMVPAHNNQNDEEIHLISSFAVNDMREENGSDTFCVQLVAAIGDRLIYTLINLHTLANHVIIRPWSIAEPIAAGFLSSNSYIKAIVERELLSYISDGTTEVVNPLNEKLILVLFKRFRWKQNLHMLLRHFSSLDNYIGGAEKNSQELSSKNVDAGVKMSTFGKNSRICNRVMASTLGGFFEWKATIEQFIRLDPGLADYAFKMDLADGDSSYFAKLPAKTSSVASLYNTFGDFFISIGCLELAVKCYDLIGNDQALLTLMIKLGGFRRLEKMSNGKMSTAKTLSRVLQSEWSRLYAKLSCISLLGAIESNMTASRLDSGHWRRHDCFSLLCCDQIFSNQERRTRLLPLSQASTFMQLHHESQNEVCAYSNVRNDVTATVLPWKRLRPEDFKDWIGKSLDSASTRDTIEKDPEECNTLRLADDEPRNPRYEILMQRQTDREDADDGKLDIALQSLKTEYDTTATKDSIPQLVKISIGPFLDDEDAVIAYWRFEEGNSILKQSENEKQDMRAYQLSHFDSYDMSKHENHLKVLSFGGLYDPSDEIAPVCMTFAPSSSPVDRGEPGRVQEPFTLRFPSSDQNREVYGAKCHVFEGSSLDLGLVFDDDPYRRKLTVECWIRNFCIVKESQSSGKYDCEDDSLDDPESSAINEMRDTRLRQLIGRSSDSGSVWWELYLEEASLCLRYADQVLQSDFKVTNASSWQHIAFTIDIPSYGHALGKLFIQGQLAGVKAFASFDETNQAKIADPESPSKRQGSFLWMGKSLENYEMTEIRLWATARSLEQLQDMKENYLGIAETKKKLKVAIHKRNCQCDKCIGYRKRKTGALVAPENSQPLNKTGSSNLTDGVGFVSIRSCFPSTPPSSKSRERRLPQPTHTNAPN